MNRLLSTASVAMLALAATGCTTPVPQAVHPTDTPRNFTAPVVKDAPVWPSANWWQGFGSPEMTGLIEDAQKDNLNIAVAYSQVLQAEAQAGISRASLFPSLGLNAGAQRSGSKGGQILVSPGGTVSESHKFSNSDQFTLGLQASYQLNLFGEFQDDYEAAKQALRASRYNQETVALTAESDVANDYLNVLALRERIKIARANVEAANRVLTIIKAKVANGVSSNLDLAQEQATVAQQEAQIPALVEQEKEARYAVAILLGRAPEGFDVKAQNLDNVSPPPVAPGLPSQLLQRRPDIAQAEATLASVHANVDAARAAFFPTLSLTGSGGLASTVLGALFNASSFEYTLGAQLLQTIFDGGLLASESDLAKAQQLQDIAQYRNTVISAFQDVETALGQVSSLAEQERLTTIEVNNAAEAFRISEIQYREGVADLLSVLQAQATLFSAQDTLVQIHLARLQAAVGLYRALGGGWSEDAAVDTQTVIPASTLDVQPNLVAPPEPIKNPHPVTPNPETPPSVPMVPGAPNSHHQDIGPSIQGVPPMQSLTPPQSPPPSQTPLPPHEQQ